MPSRSLPRDTEPTVPRVRNAERSRIARAARRVTLVLACAAVACDPIRIGGIALAPSPTAPLDSVSQSAFALTARVAARHGLDRVVPPKEAATEWQQCFGKTGFLLCGELFEGEVQFQLSDWHRSKWSPLADSVRQDLMDSLQAEFGQQHVHECDWRGQPGSRTSICTPTAGPDQK